MIEMKSIRKVGKAVLTGLATAALVFSAPVGAFADAGGGLGGGGKVGDGKVPAGPYPWKSIAFDQQGEAWKRFLKEDSRSDSYTTQRVNDAFSRANNGGRTGEQICKESRVIWYIERSDKRWHFNFTGNTNGSPDTAGSSVMKPKRQIGRAPLPEEIRAFQKWDEKNGNLLNSAPGYTIVCSGAFTPEPRISNEVETKGSRTSNVAATNVDSFTAPYSYVASVTPMMGKNGKPLGDPELHGQGGKETITNFGKLYNEMNKAGDKNPTTVRNKINAAVNADKKMDRAGVNLDVKNKNGMAKGGILNVNEQAKNATITLTKRVQTNTRELCKWTEKWNSSLNGGKGGYEKDPNTKSCRTETTTLPAKYDTTVSQGTLQPSGFWQMLSVKCNSEQLKALLDSDKTLSAKVKEDSGSHFATVVTKKYDVSPKQLDFGDPNNSNSAKKATADQGFFEKVCSFSCVPSNKGGKATKDNGAVRNVVNTGKVPNGALYGASSNDVNSNYFEFFRDNEAKRIRPDVWYPQNKGNVSYDGKAPKGTLILRDLNGTPSLDGTKGGKFSMTYEDGKNVFTPGKTDPVKVVSGKDSFGENAGAAYVPGLKENFDVKSTWASEADRPQVLNFGWNYALSANNTVPTNNIGFGAGGAAKTGSTSVVKAPVEGLCFGGYGPEGDKIDRKEDVKNANEGLKGINPSTKPAQSDNKNLVINFVRSTGE